MLLTTISRLEPKSLSLRLANRDDWKAQRDVCVTPKHIVAAKGVMRRVFSTVDFSTLWLLCPVFVQDPVDGLDRLPGYTNGGDDRKNR